MLEFLKHVFKLQFLLIIIAVLAGIYYPQLVEQLQMWLQPDTVDIDPLTKVFTKVELAQYNGENDAPLYLSLLGCVYDVSKGSKHYGPGCSYNFFVGRDASVSFVTGDFENYVEGEADDVLMLKPSDLLSLANWKSFYDNDYIYKGKLIGRFYDDSGSPTPYQYKYLELVEQARKVKAETEQLRTQYPDCNIEWSPERGTRVWCTPTSGGKERDWKGYPRKLFEINSSDYRCACLQEELLDTKEIMIKPYDNCDLRAHECYYKVD